MRCLVTGASGHIGSHLVRCLLSNGAEVAIFIRPTSNLWRLEDVVCRVKVIKGDLTEIKESNAAIREFAPETVFHLAWSGVGARDRNEITQLTQNLYGSIELLRLAVESGCKRWIGLGSQAEYGIYDGVLNENLPARPVTLYGTVKLCLCLLCRKLCEAGHIDFAWLRLLASYGPMDDRDHLIPYVILTLLRNEEPSLTFGEQRWDFLYVEDVAEALWRVAVTPEARGVFNLGSGESYVIRSIIERIRDLINPKLSLGFGKLPYRPDQIMRLETDIASIRRVTGWSPRANLNEGLRRTVEWFRKNRRRYEM
jgi:nucleoside-diphosphate-sugar epimerase